MDWASIITSIGFPIAACIAMAMYCKTITDSYKKDIMEIIKNNWDEMSKVTEALRENTEAIQGLRQYIERECRDENN